jgi:xylulokinase
MKHYVGIDLGTQSMKGILMSPDNRMLAEASSEYLPDYPRPGWAENDTGLWIDALKEILASLRAKAGIRPEDIGTLGIVAQNGGVVPVDRDGNALDRCVIWLDSRSEPQCRQLLERIGQEEARGIVGADLTSMLCISKIMWFQQNRPDIYHQAHKFLDITPFLVGYLTGNPVSDYGNASWSLLYDVVRQEWSPRMLDAAGIDPAKLCDVRSAYEVAGTVRPNRAAALGLSPSTAVMVGGSDLHAAMLGCGLVSPGKILDISGTGEMVITYVEKPIFDKTGILSTHLCLQPGYWSLEQGTMITGGSVRWFRDTVSHKSFAEMDDEAAAIPPGSDGLLFLPYLSGAATPRVIGHARGAFFGLSMSHNQAHLTRAVYEGCTFGVRDCVERMDELGCGADSVIACGGGAKSDLWCQMKADALGKPVQVVKSPHSTPLGAAILAGVTQGNFQSAGDAVSQLVELGRVYEPDPAQKPLYDEAYAFYKKCAEHFAPLYDRYV